MGTMNFSIPDDLKERFNELFKDQNKSAIVTELMRRAVEDEERRRRGASLVERMAEIRSQSRGVTAEAMQQAREELRK